jgi:basic amino acid/polyamine antiporter, APA family
MAELKRVLGFWTILSLSVGSIAGTGMFFAPAIASSFSGNASILAWVILTFIALYISFYFAELVSMYPKAGGVYEFSKHAYGKFVSFLMAWIAWIVGNLTTVLLIVAAIDYLIPNPSQILLKVGISIGLILILNLIAFFGIEASAFMLIFFVVVTIGSSLAIIVPGAFEINTSNYTPFYEFGVFSIFVTIFFLAESFFGWEGATYLSEETQNPEKVIPKAIILGTVIVGLLGTGITVISLGIVPWQELAGSSAPLSIISDKLLGFYGRGIINVGIFVALIGSAAGGIITMPRLLLALARDKLFISQFSEVHEKYNTPYKAIIFQTIVSLAIFAMAFGRYTELLSLALPLGLIMYIFLIFAVVILRIKEPDIKRTFKVPFLMIGSFLLISMLILILGAYIFPDFNSVNPEALITLKMGFSFIFVGIPIYLLLETYYDPDTIIKINDYLAYLTLFMEGFILPKSVREKILELLGDVKDKKVLEFGCSVGTFTMHLAEAVLPHGKVYATDLSRKDLKIIGKRLQKRNHTHVKVIHDEHQVNRVHPSIPHVDCIVSIGMMGYLQDTKKVLREMRELLPYGGKVVFVDYADFFKVIPNVAWLSNDKVIEKVFRDSGFSVFVSRKKGLFWSYIYVYGIKFQEDIAYI